MTKPPRRPLSRRKKLLFTAVTTVVVTCVAYLVLLVSLSEQLYRYVTTNQRGYQGRISRSDAELGFAPIAGARGAEVFPVGPPIPIVYDADGCRVPTEPRLVAADSPTLLALGCSFTFGAACRAEHCFAELVGADRSLRVRNAGVGAYGLVQMLRLARRHVPAMRPRVVLVQFSPWLITRARNSMAPSYYGRLPVPYFARTADESLAIRGPMFAALVTELPLSEYREHDAGRLSFYWSCGFPLYLHDHWGLVVSRLRSWPEPEPDRRKVVRLCYGEIARLCDAVGARMLVVALGPEEPSLDEVRALDGVELVRAEQALRAALALDGEAAYEQRYNHWRGTPPVLVDRHPNEVAHRLIADQILVGLDR